LRLSIEHRTRYGYETPLERGVQLVRLWPSAHAGLAILRWDVRARGGRVGRSFVDGFGNRCALTDLNAETRAAEIIVEGAVETRDGRSLVVGASEPLPPDYFLRATPRTSANEAIVSLARSLTGAAGARAEALMNVVRDRIEFRVGATSVEGNAADALKKGEGVCQDHAHVYCAIARAAGLPARYVSGYLFTGEDHSPAAHAWVEAFDGESWLGLDPANRTRVGEAYVRLAIGLDYRDAAPVVGARTGGGAETLSVDVNVHAQQ
jgi:transglutaminase-like putative cysteine protease